MINIHKNFKLNSNNYNKKELLYFASCNIQNNDVDLYDLSVFILEIFNIESYVLCKTSGSTGIPKDIKLEKSSLLSSVYMTRDYFNLKPNQSAVSFLPMNFIAGKMMLLRSMVIGLDLQLFNPTSNPSELIDKNYFFSAMTPMQAYNSISKLKFINTLILGGTDVSNSLRSRILSKIDTYYETYGMTETASHIAIKKVSKNNQLITNFKVLDGVTISKNSNNCLTIEAPAISSNIIITNDIVEIISTNEFSVIGRKDNIINSGGVKLVPEEIERKLSKYIYKNFIISSIKDEILGDKVILIIESEKYKLKKEVFNYLNKFEKPKQIYFISKFIYTKSNKIDRISTKQTIN
ncbi:AMP-binding protein [Flavobacteriaceae bacterium]|nr:AMP-binding protein [Flavobacteriaceae bacterium]MDC1491942.1 AMP-binding protein [Flavobacteriaceae bacterium]